MDKEATFYIDGVSHLTTTQEMMNVADFMRQRGRVSMMELAKQSNKLIDLDEVELKVEEDAESIQNETEGDR